MAKTYNRAERVGQMLQRELAELVQKEVKDPRLSSLITVSGVDVSRDFEHAKVYVMVLGKQDDIELALHILNNAAGFLRKLLGKRIKLRAVPALRFFHDTSISYGHHIDTLLDKVKDEQSKS